MNSSLIATTGYFRWAPPPVNYRMTFSLIYLTLAMITVLFFAILLTIIRKQVHKNCLEDLGNTDKFTSFVYYKLNVQEHLLYLRNHIKNVEISFRIFNEIFNKHIKSDVGVDPEEIDAKEEQFKHHDESKYSFFECLTYMFFL